jgi:phospholipase C
MSAALTRRTLLKATAGVMAAQAVPAWARPHHRHHHRALRAPDSLPFPHLPAGTESLEKIKHVVVVMMENHSFDNLLGMVPHQVRGRAGVDGLTRMRGRVLNANRDGAGHRVFARHHSSPCQEPSEPSQSWNASHQSYAGGRNDGFVKASGPIAMQFWDERDIPFTYSLTQHFPIGERFFCSVLAQTYPNRRFFFTGTASGTIATDNTTFTTPAANGTIYDRLNRYGIDYATYYQQVPSVAIVPNNGASPLSFHNYSQFHADAAAGKLPAFTFIDPNYDTTSEENPQDIQVGEEFLADVVQTLTSAPTWSSTALFITYDEHGGYYDHVPPPPAVKPDAIPPMTKPGDYPGGYGRYGFRVPLIVVSPWARRRYVSDVTQDHTSITAFIERKWNLPAMTFRDANAHPMTDYFDFRRPHFATPPKLHPAPPLDPGLAKCRANGENPPLPGPTSVLPLPESDVARYLRR